MLKSESHKEEQVRQALSARLEVREELLVFTPGVVAAWFACDYYVGLAAERLILIDLGRDKPGGKILSRRRELIRGAKRAGAWLSASPQVKLAIAASLNGLAGLIDPHSLAALRLPCVFSARSDLAIGLSLWRDQTRWKAFAGAP